MSTETAFRLTPAIKPEKQKQILQAVKASEGRRGPPMILKIITGNLRKVQSSASIFCAIWVEGRIASSQVIFGCQGASESTGNSV
jgi:hypothetical protein